MCGCCVEELSLHNLWAAPASIDALRLWFWKLLKTVQCMYVCITFDLTLVASLRLSVPARACMRPLGLFLRLHVMQCFSFKASSRLQLLSRISCSPQLSCYAQSFHVMLLALRDRWENPPAQFSPEPWLEQALENGK